MDSLDQFGSFIYLFIFSTYQFACLNSLYLINSVLQGYNLFSLILQKEDQLRDALRFANACGALTVMERGAIPALPTREAVLNAIHAPVS